MKRILETWGGRKMVDRRDEGFESLGGGIERIVKMVGG